MSSYNLLAVVDGESDDPLYPLPGERRNEVEREATDGTATAPIAVTELVLHELPAGGQSKRLMRMDDIKAALIITDARVAVACSKYTKGGGWVGFGLGGVAVALTANAVSKSRAARRRRGKMLAGHIRYPSLLSVGFKPKSTPIGRDRLRLGTADPRKPGRDLFLDLTLGRAHTAGELAQAITTLAAAHRLRHADGELDAAERERLKGLLKPPMLAPHPKQFVGYEVGR